MFILFILAIVIVVWAIVTKKEAGCDMDCKHCPFPECSPKQKAYLRWLMNK